MKKKVAFFVYTLESGGIENYLLRFLTYYKDDIEAYVFCKSGYGGVLEDQYRKVGANIVYCKVGYIFSSHVHRMLKDQGYEAVCDFSGNFAGFILRQAKRAGIKKRIAFYRGATNHFKESYLKLAYNNFVRRLVNKFATTILFNSNAALEFFYPYRSPDDKRFRVIYNGIDADSFLSTKDNLRALFRIPDNAFVVGHVGRYTEAKNHKLVLEVAIRLCQQYPDIYFVLCGRGVDENLKGEVEELDLQDRIILLGNRTDVVKVLNTLNCFYFPSLTEGQPNALLEALVVGVPFVASNIEPIKECIPAAYHEQLVDITSVGPSINKILEIYNGEKRVDLSEWARNFYDPKTLFNLFYKEL